MATLIRTIPINTNTTYANLFIVIEPLIYWININTSELSVFNMAGILIQYFPLPDEIIRTVNFAGFNTDGKYLYITDGFLNRIWVLDTRCNIIRTVDIPPAIFNPVSLGHDGKYYYLTQLGDPYIYKCDTSCNIIKSILVPAMAGSLWACTHNGKYLYCYNPHTAEFKMFDINFTLILSSIIPVYVDDITSISFNNLFLYCGILNRSNIYVYRLN